MITVHAAVWIAGTKDRKSHINSYTHQPIRLKGHTEGLLKDLRAENYLIWTDKSCFYTLALSW